MFVTRTVGVHVSILVVLCPLQSPSCALFCFAAIMLCPRCNVTLKRRTGGKKNCSDFQTGQGTPACMDKISGHRFNCCRICSPTYFRLYPKYVMFNPAMTLGDEEWCAICNALRDAWPALVLVFICIGSESQHWDSTISQIRDVPIQLQPYAALVSVGIISYSLQELFEVFWLQLNFPWGHHVECRLR